MSTHVSSFNTLDGEPKPVVLWRMLLSSTLADVWYWLFARMRSPVADVIELDSDRCMVLAGRKDEVAV
jgi:hypothetical protein